MDDKKKEAPATLSTAIAELGLDGARVPRDIGWDGEGSDAIPFIKKALIISPGRDPFDGATVRVIPRGEYASLLSNFPLDKNPRIGAMASLGAAEGDGWYDAVFARTTDSDGSAADLIDMLADMAAEAASMSGFPESLLPSWVESDDDYEAFASSIEASIGFGDAVVCARPLPGEPAKMRLTCMIPARYLISRRGSDGRA